MSPPRGAAGGGGTDSAQTGTMPVPPPLYPDAGGAPPAPVARGCEALASCCAGLVDMDEIACITVLETHDEEYCRESVFRFCWNVPVCGPNGCSSHGGP